MKRFLYSLACLLMYSGLCFAQKKDVLWVKKLPHNTLPIQMAHDAAGNIYIAGTMWETCAFDNITITSVGDNDVFLVKYDRDGNLLWVKNTAGVRREESGGVTVDHSGNVYICGYFTPHYDTSSIFGQKVVSRGNEDMFVAKLDANGNTEWIKTAGGKHEDRFYTGSMAIDAGDNIYITGRIIDTAYFGNIIVTTPQHGLDAFVASYDKNGNERWGQALGSTFNYPFGRAITIDHSGNVYATGMIGQYQAMYIVKYDMNGTMLWIKKIDSPNGHLHSYDITAAPNGNIYIAGGMSDTVTFGNKTFISKVSGFRSFILACDNAGNILWADTAGHYSNYPTHIATDAYSNAYIGSEPAIYTRYDEAGNRQWQEPARADNATYTFDDDGYMYITGSTDLTQNQSYLPDTTTFLVKLAQFPTNVASTKTAIQVSAYPNPATNTLTITAPANGTYQIMALNGTIYLSGNISKEKSVDIHALPIGIYVLQYEAGKETAYTMFEKQ